jgi:hypothetical protein
MKPFLTVLALFGIVLAVLAPPEVKVVAVFLLFCIPGFAIVCFVCPQKELVDQIILSVLTGLAFQIVYNYMVSMVIHFSLLTLSIPAIFAALFFDFKGNLNLKIDKKAFLIFVPAVLFGGLTLNLVPGEDAIAHLLIVDDIVEAAAVPQTYALYPEIPRTMYPVGFHILTAQLQLFSGSDDLIFGVASLLSALLVLSVYWCTAKLFSPECGLLAGTLSVFATVPPLNSLILSTYTTLLAYIFTCIAIGVIAEYRNGSKHFILLSLILAAGIETHLFFFLVLIPISLFLVQILTKEHGKEGLRYVYVIGLLILFSAPFLVHIVTGYHSSDLGPSLQYIIQQEHHYFLLFTPEMIPEEIGVWIVLVGALGFALLEKYRLLFASWICIFLFLALNTLAHIEFPLWYTFFAPRMIDQLFLPFSILGAFFLIQIKQFSRIGAIILCGILLLSGGAHVIQAPRADRGDLFPTISPFFETDQQGMLWLLNTEEDAVILNDWWTGTGSAWIPSLIRKQVVFPYVVNAFSINVFTLENYVEDLNLIEKEQKNFIIAAFPDSEETCRYLKELKVDYIFLSSYVLEESKWRSALWNPFALEESPNYDIAFQEGYTYIFSVASEFEYSIPFVLKEVGPITVTPERPYKLDVSLNPLSFSVDRILDIVIEKSGWGTMEIVAEGSLLAVVPLTDTEHGTHVAFRIPPDVNDVTFSVENQPITMAVSVSTAFRECFQYEHDIALVGDSWGKVIEGYEIRDQGHIYLFNTSKILEMAYVDSGEGNIDFNLFVNGEWEKLTTIYRENDGKMKTVYLELPEGYTLLDIGIKNWGDPFVIVGLGELGYSPG